MIQVDHAPGSGPTVAERSEPSSRPDGVGAPVAQSYTTTKRARDLRADDAIAVNFRGFGNLVMQINWRDAILDDDGDVKTVWVGLVAPSHHEQIEAFNPDDTVVLHPLSRVGTWL